MSARTVHGTVEFIWDDDGHMLVNLEPDDPGDPHTFELTGDLRDASWPTRCRRATRVEVEFKAEPYEVLDPDSGPSESLRAEVVDVRVVGCTRAAPVHRHGRAADRRRLVRAQEPDHAGDLGGRDPARVVGVGLRRAVRRCVDHAREHGVAAHAAVAVVGRDGLRERQHRGLRRDVADRAAERLHRGARGHAHDRPAAGVEHVRHGGARDQERGPQVEAEELLEVLERGLVQRRPGGIAAHQVHHRPQPARAERRLRDGVADLVLLEQVGLHQLQPFAVGHALALLRHDPGRNHVPAGLQHRVHHGSADRAGRAGDQHGSLVHPRERSLSDCWLSIPAPARSS